ncbi:MAG: hypothetical protein WC053_04140 [Sideroxydans sp.]
MQKTGRMLAGLVTLVLALWSVQAVGAETQVIGRDFKHMTTGFPLTGGHAAAACETCHVGGVFKGTPRACDGCHAMGKRVVATPKPNSHIVTDAPCESCHFYSHTWLGARYNHGSAVPGQCRNCHVGRMATGKPGSHGTGKKATESCDSCHRTFAWTPASWNHNLSPGVCSTCHSNAAIVSAPNLKPAGHAAPALKGTEACDACHSYSGWYPNRFKHNTGAACASCHNGSIAVGKTGSHTTTSKATFACNDCHITTTSWLPAQYRHTSPAACSSCHDGIVAGGKSVGHVATTNECNQCHMNTTTWSGALGAKPPKHIPYSNASEPCTSCHVGTSSVKTGSALHTYLGGIACYTCHGSNTVYSGQGQKTERWPNFHESSKNPGATDCSASGCHRPLGSKGNLYINWD